MFSGRMTPFVIASRTSATDLPEKSSRSAALAAAAPACWPRPAAVPARLRPLVAAVRLRDVPDLAADERELEERDDPDLAPDDRLLVERDEDDDDERDPPEERDPDERELDDREPEDDERDPPEREPPDFDEPDEREPDEREPDDDERELEPPDLRRLDPPLPPDDSAIAVPPQTKFARDYLMLAATAEPQARGRRSPNPRRTISADSPRLPRCGSSPSCTATS